MAISLTRIKGVETEDHKIKIISFADNITILLRDIPCLNKIKVNLKLYEDVSSSKIYFSQSKPLWTGAYKSIIDQPGQIEWSQFSMK